jgi:hypothetical protein
MHNCFVHWHNDYPVEISYKFHLVMPHCRLQVIRMYNWGHTTIKVIELNFFSHLFFSASLLTV